MTYPLEERLRLVHELSLLSPCSALETLHDLRAVSSAYDLRHLAYDHWYLYYSRNSFRTRVDPQPEVVGESMLLFRVTIQSLVDVVIGKPCDLGLWSRDQSPCSDKSKKCTRDAHSCAEDALRFLTEITADQEVFMGLSPGTVSCYLVAIEKQSSWWSSAGNISGG